MTLAHFRPREKSNHGGLLEPFGSVAAASHPGRSPLARCDPLA